MAGSVINTFDKGLHQDSSFILQPDGTYRNMKNGMLISYDGNHYTVEMPQGNNVTLELPSRYLPENDSSGELKDAISSPIGFISFIDKLVVFTTNNESSGGYGEIGVIQFRKDTDLIKSYYTPYYHHPSLNFSKLHKIEGFSFKENNSIERIYWTDNNNEPRVFDIANPIFTTYIASGSLNIGQTYMVMNGVIANGGNWYGPSGGTNIPTAPNYVNGNVFTATDAAYTTVSGIPLVIEYFPLSLLDWTPTRTMGNINFVEYGIGNKNCGSHIYFYRLSSSLEGIQTSWSYGSNPIHVGMDNESPYLTGVPYRDFVGNGNQTAIFKSDKSVKVRIQNIDTNFDTIELCCAEFDQTKDVPYSITIVVKKSVTGSLMDLEDKGNSNFGTVTISDLTLFPASILKCKTISTNKNYSTIAKITEREEFELDLSTVIVSQVEYPMISHGGFATCTGGNVPADQSPNVLANPGVGDIKPWSRYVVSLAPDAANRVEYPVASGTYYYTNDVFVGVVGSTTATFTGTAQARPCTTKNQYTKINSSAFSGNRVENFIELKTGFWDYKDPAVASHNKGYWSNEKYRVAFIGFDLKGNPFYAKHIKDFSFNAIPDKGGLMRKDTYSGDDIYSLNPSGLNISGLDIPESVMNQLSGFSIVRAERDPVIITQGLLMQSVYSNLLGFNSVMPLGICRTDYSVLPMYEVGDGYYIYSVLSPDIQTGYSFPSAVKIGDNLKEACWLNGTQLKTDTQKRVMFTKLFNMPVGAFGTGKDASTPRTLTIQSMNGNAVYNFTENTGAGGFLGTGVDYRNRYSNVNETLVIANYDSICGITPFIPGFDILSVGCKKQVIKSQFNHFDALTDYNAPANVANYNKMLANFITETDPASQYGGVTDAAIADTLYMSCGHFQPINSTVKADTLNGTFASGTYAGENKYTFNDIEVFGGDCFTNLVDLGYGLWDETFETFDNAMSYALWFPCEGNVNYNLRRGLKVSNKNMHPSSGATGIGWFDSSLSPTTQLESYSYNKAYSTDGNFIKYPALPLNYKFTGEFDYRIRWSQYKTPGELIDSFRVFRIPDYRDVDGQRGQINNLKARDSKLFYWQDHSVGYVPILERQLVGGSALGDATALGVTGVIDRYEDIDTYFGNQHQHGLTETEYGFAWFDMRRRAFIVMGIGGKPEEVSMIKGLQVFFNNTFNEAFTDKSKSIYSTNNIDFVEAPLMGYGIVGCYDNRYKMTYITFKYTEIKDRLIFLNKDFTIGYSHVLNAFVSFFDNCPAIWHSHNDLVLSANNPKNTKAYNIDMPSTSYVIEDTISLDNVEYICISPVTISSYPGTLTAGGTNPKAAGVSGSLNDFWRPINKTSNIYLNGIQSSICEFYGKIWPHEIDIIVNAKTNNAVTPQNYQFKGMGPNWTDVEAFTDNQTASDLNISATNRNYRWIDKSWFASLPLPTNGRLTDYYVRIKFTFKNYVSDPTVSKNVQKISQWLRTTFVSKR
jgi:hypothetical protein